MDDTTPDGGQSRPEARRVRAGHASVEREQRSSSASSACRLVVILIFILQNQKIVEVSFLIFSGRLPLAVALLFAMILGAVIVFAFGAARILQLRMVAGRAPRESGQKAS